MKKFFYFINRFILRSFLIVVTLFCLWRLSDKIVANEPSDEQLSQIFTEEPVPLISEAETEVPAVPPIDYHNQLACILCTNAIDARSAAEHYVTILMCGDMLAGGYTHKSGLMEDGTYNYDRIFENVSDIIQKADLALLNQEVILGGTSLGLSGYPLFNAAFELGDAEVNAGFDIILQASNHTLDQGTKGFDLCMDYWHTNHPEIDILGVNESKEAQDEIYIKEINGIKIAILNYTYGTNGLSMPSNRPYMVNMMDENKMVSDIERARELADFVIVAPHWGTEYTLTQTKNQEMWAQLFADHGADLILGTHPHVVEPIQWITGVNGNKTLVYYSLGNFSSNQAQAKTMLGIFSLVRLVRTKDGVSIDSYGAIPLVNHYTSDWVTTFTLNDYPEDIVSQNYILKRDSSFTLEYMQEIYDEVIGDLPQNILDLK